MKVAARIDEPYRQDDAHADSLVSQARTGTPYNIIAITGLILISAMWLVLHGAHDPANAQQSAQAQSKPSLSGTPVEILQKHLKIIREQNAAEQKAVNHINTVLSSGAKITALSEGLHSGLLEQLVAQQEALEADLKHAEESLHAAHPKRKRLAAELKELQKHISQEAKDIVQRRKNHMRMLSERADILRDGVNVLKASQTQSGAPQKMRSILLRAERMFLQERERVLMLEVESGNLNTVWGLLENEQFLRLFEQKIQNQILIAGLSPSLASAHPTLRRLKAELGDIDEDIKAEAKKYGQSLVQKIRDIEKQEKALIQ